MSYYYYSTWKRVELSRRKTTQTIILEIDKKKPANMDIIYIH